MERVSLGKSGLEVTPVGFGAFKLGRNLKAKYPEHYELPDEATAVRMLNYVLDLGVNLIDTAPAYGISEERIGKGLKSRRDEFCLSSKTGEQFIDGVSNYDYSATTTTRSIEQSLQRLQTDRLDIVYVHSNGRDLEIQEDTAVVETLQKLKQAGKIRAIGFSAKTVPGARKALDWADVLMLEYHIGDLRQAPVIEQAFHQEVGVVIKKGLASGHLAAPEAIRFVLGNPCVHSMVIGGSNPDHFAANCRVADQLFKKSVA